MVNFTGFATMLFVPYFLVRITGLPVAESGVIMAVGPIGMMIASNFAGQAVVHVGAKRLAILAGLLVATGLWWISYWEASTGPAVLCAALLLHGTGLGLFQVAALEFVASSLPVSQRGVAGSLALVMRTIGVVVAASVLTLAFAHVQGETAIAQHDGGFIAAFQTVFRYASAGLALYLAISLLRAELWLSRTS